MEELESDWFSLDDVRELLRLANEMPLDVDRDLLLEVFKPVALEVLSENIDEEIKDRDILEEFLDEKDMDRVAEKVCEAIADLCAEIGVEVDSSEIDDLYRRVNIEGIIESNIRRACRDDDYHDVGRDAITGPNEIHDLFSMDIPPSS